MPDTQTVDEVVSPRAPGASGGRPAGRLPVIEETVDAQGAIARVSKSAHEETMTEGGAKGRTFKDSTLKLLAQLDGGKPAPKAAAPKAAPAPHEEGDADEDEAPAPAPHEEGDADEEAPAEGEATEEAPAEGETKDETPPELEVLRADKTRLEQTNKALVAQLDAAKKTPRAERTPREQALIEAEAAYVDEGTVPALRKFLSVITGTAPDSKQVSEELAGLFADLSANELNVSLDQSQQAMRKASRAQLALARDKREKAESDKKAATPADVGEEQQIAGASRVIDTVLSTKTQAGTSLADEYPHLMTLAEHFDGMKPTEVLARAIKGELLAGSLDPNAPNEVNIRAVAAKIEAHYKAGADRIAAVKSKTDTTKGASKQAPATAPSKTQSSAKAPGARTISNATAGKAPNTAPKAKQATKQTGEKRRADFKSDQEWRQYLFDKHQLNT